jgi:cyclic pyranopterin phosphate synthase
VEDPIDPARLIERVRHDGIGAVSLFLGTVRDVNEGRAVTGMDYEVYRPMAELELRRIADEAVAREPALVVALEHRVGTLGLGETSVAIACAHPHRAPAMDAARWIIDTLKQLDRPDRRRGVARMSDRADDVAVSLDQFGRRIEYLRISVTDRCNFRCLYCMPADGLPWLPKERILRYEEIAEIVRQLVPLGLRRLRITGGEPTIRPALATLVRMLRDIRGVEDIALSTNGVRLPELAPALADAGLDRVNVSADSLRADRVASIARRDLGFDLVRAVDAAAAAGLAPIKVNVVVMRGINDDEVTDFAALTRERALHVRFIELMPVGELRDLTWEHVVPSAEVLERIAGLGPLEPTAGPARGNGPATYWRLAGAAGTVGVITPMTHSYCERCNRVRLTADGRLRTCLFGEHEVPLRDALRRGDPLAPLFRQALAEKPAAHELLQLRTGGLRALSEVGG